MKNMLQKFEFHKTERKIFIKSVITAIDAVRPKDFYFPGEMHNFWEIVCVAEGAAMATADERVYNLKKGNLLFHKPMEFHRIWSSDGTSPRVIFITFSATGDGFDMLGNGVFKINETLDAAINEALSNAVYCRDIEDPFKIQLAAVNMERFLLMLLESQIPESRQQKTIGTANYKEIIRVMNENLDKNLSSEDIAALCVLGLSNLKKTFRRYAGTGVMEYFNHLKILRAMDLINSGLSMREISEALGYSSPNYFSDAFKRQCGITPTEYKRDYVTDIGGILL